MFGSFGITKKQGTTSSLFLLFDAVAMHSLTHSNDWPFTLKKKKKYCNGSMAA